MGVKRGKRRKLHRLNSNYTTWKLFFSCWRNYRFYLFNFKRWWLEHEKIMFLSFFMLKTLNWFPPLCVVQYFSLILLITFKLFNNEIKSKFIHKGIIVGKCKFQKQYHSQQKLYNNDKQLFIKKNISIAPLNGVFPNLVANNNNYFRIIVKY